jgi:hypothetical protein
MPILEEDELDTSYDLTESEHVEAIREQAYECMDLYFKDKVFWADQQKIPKSKLYREEHIKVVMEMTVMDAFAIAYYCLEKNPPDTVKTEDKAWDIKLCYESLKECTSMGIPKCHAGGMMLVYLSVCHGVNFIPTLKRLHEIRASIQERERQMQIVELTKQQDEEDVRQKQGGDRKKRRKLLKELVVE